MKLLAALAVAGVLAGAAIVIAQFTLSREGKVDPGSTTTVTFTVEGRGFEQPLDVAAAGLWGVCSNNVASQLAGEIVEVGESAYQLRLRPSLDDDDQKKLRGCLNDATIDRVQADVIRIETRTPYDRRPT